MRKLGDPGYAAEKRHKALLKEMVEAHTDLNIFAGVVALLEGGTMSADAQPYDFKVIALCQRAQQQCLRRYDRAREAALKSAKDAKP